LIRGVKKRKISKLCAKLRGQRIEPGFLQIKDTGSLFSKTPHKKSKDTQGDGEKKENRKQIEGFSGEEKEKRGPLGSNLVA